MALNPKPWNLLSFLPRIGVGPCPHVLGVEDFQTLNPKQGLGFRVQGLGFREAGALIHYVLRFGMVRGVRPLVFVANPKP